MISMAMTSDEFVEMLSSICPVPAKTPAEKLTAFKKMVDKTPDKFLQFHLDWSINEENYELSVYIRDTIEKRKINPHNTPSPSPLQ